MKSLSCPAALFFHGSIAWLIRYLHSRADALFYIVLTLITSLVVHFATYKGVFVRYWPEHLKDDAILSRLFTVPLLATANIAVAAISLFIASFIHNPMGEHLKK
ncbi:MULTISPECIES: hypothetical protein [Idiomarina]|jgi:hypothetical protein|uniref:hypothetical protein n=1 Tax=Idiomarina TaxID=135575 RepID=UPI000332765C|nr:MULTISPECIES: hypothetical protein [Idiomarina]AGM37479.1 hypothetical protein K734_13100 [Idiomarina loihiensis GSL 199]MBF39431.1 hypothetical protein [Idiomarinaceae bacterium]|tara:strand:- start:20204 stop:20515 length:312 start_codon:yes stop_codon:yes gene_type:complete